MFVSDRMQQHKTSDRKPYSSGQVLPVLKSEQLLAASRHQGLIRQCTDLSRVGDDAFNIYYKPVIHQFAEFVQLLPMENDAPLSGLLNVSMARAQAALMGYVAERAGELDPLLCYAVYTAALLRDVAKVIINQKVVLCSEEGEYKDDWLPFAGTMCELQGEFYKLYPIAPIYQRLEDSLTPAIARQLMPSVGFLWITSDLQIYADWLDALCGRDGQGGQVTRALAKLRREDIYNISKTLDPVSVEMLQSIATQYGDAFFAWLKEGIQKGTIPINTADAGVHVTADGVFLEKNKVFHQFADMMSLPVSINVVFSQFGNMFGIAKKGGYDFMNAQFFSQYASVTNDQGMAFSSPLGSRQKNLRHGMVLGDPSMVFMNAQIPATTPLLKSMQTSLPASHRVPSATSSSQQAKVSPNRKPQ